MTREEFDFVNRYRLPTSQCCSNCFFYSDYPISSCRLRIDKNKVANLISDIQVDPVGVCDRWQVRL